LTLVFIPAVRAADEWCDTDPPVQLTTLSGRHAVVFVTDSGKLTGNKQLDKTIQGAVASAQVTSQRNPTPVMHGSVSGTEFTIFVSIPNTSNGTSFPVRSTAGTLSFGSNLAGPTYGTSGSAPVALTIWLAN